MDLPTDILRTFVAAADAESYTSAAAMVHRTQSAISMQMKRLEEGVGRPLFQRDGRSMKLTSEGQTLLWYARRILKLHDEAMAAVARPELSGRVRLGAPDDYAERLLPKVLARFAGTYPQVQVDVFCEPGDKLLTLLDNGELDLVVRTCGEVPERGETIYREEVVWITSSRHLAHEHDPLPIAVYHEGCIFRQWAVKSLDGAGRSYRIAYTSPGTAGILAAVKGGLAVAPMGRSTLPDGVRILGPADGFPPLPTAVVTLIKPSGPLTPAVESLAKHVAESFRELEAAPIGGLHVDSLVPV